jgi:hypothetical protein
VATKRLKAVDEGDHPVDFHSSNGLQRAAMGAHSPAGRLAAGVDDLWPESVSLQIQALQLGQGALVFVKVLGAVIGRSSQMCCSGGAIATQQMPFALSPLRPDAPPSLNRADAYMSKGEYGRAPPFPPLIQHPQVEREIRGGSPGPPGQEWNSLTFPFVLPTRCDQISADFAALHGSVSGTSATQQDRGSTSAFEGGAVMQRASPNDGV